MPYIAASAHSNVLIVLFGLDYRDREGVFWNAKVGSMHASGVDGLAQCTYDACIRVLTCSGISFQGQIQLCLLHI